MKILLLIISLKQIHRYFNCMGQHIVLCHLNISNDAFKCISILLRQYV